jgi:hypothetical protein
LGTQVRSAIENPLPAADGSQLDFGTAALGLMARSEFQRPIVS